MLRGLIKPNLGFDAVLAGSFRRHMRLGENTSGCEKSEGTHRIMHPEGESIPVAVRTLAKPSNGFCVQFLIAAFGADSFHSRLVGTWESVGIYIYIYINAFTGGGGGNHRFTNTNDTLTRERDTNRI